MIDFPTQNVGFKVAHVVQDEPALRIRFATPLPTMEQASYAFFRAYLQAALEATRGNACKAAEAIRVHRNTLTRLCDQHGIPRGYGRQKRARHAS